MLSYALNILKILGDIRGQVNKTLQRQQLPSPQKEDFKSTIISIYGSTFYKLYIMENSRIEHANHQVYKH